MFGYIKISPEQLRMGEIQEYRRIYCGLCHQMAEYSQFSRLFLSFDMVFFTILTAYENKALSEKCTRKKCLKTVPCPDGALDFWAAMSIVMICQKLRNDMADGEKKAALFQLNLKNAYEKAAQRYPKAECCIRDALERIYELERQNSTEAETIMGIFGNMSRELLLLSPLSYENANLKELMGDIAQNLSEWIYAVDFYDDAQKDAQQQAYNPLVLRAQQENSALSQIKEQFRSVIDQRVMELQRLCAFLPYSGFQVIVRNVLHEGVISVTADVYSGSYTPQKYK